MFLVIFSTCVELSTSIEEIPRTSTCTESVLDRHFTGVFYASQEIFVILYIWTTYNWLVFSGVTTFQICPNYIVSEGRRVYHSKMMYIHVICNLNMQEITSEKEFRLHTVDVSCTLRFQFATWHVLNWQCYYRWKFYFFTSRK